VAINADQLRREAVFTADEIVIATNAIAKLHDTALYDPIWPKPQQMESGHEIVILNLAGLKSTHAVVAGGLARFERDILQRRVANDPITADILDISITIHNASESLQMETDESYTLVVPLQGNITITAATCYGALHALQSLGQLVRYSGRMQRYYIGHAPCTVIDSPRFKHRELLVDTARHYIFPATLKLMIDSLAYTKMNVMHWHLSDTESFPFESPSSPRLSMGSYSAVETYTLGDVSDIVEYARMRAVRVIVEFDAPGHAASWCRGYPEVCPSPTCLEPLNPATPATFEMIRSLLSDLVNGPVFEQFVHLGGDEVNFHCWSSTPSIREWMSSKGFDERQTYKYFIDQTIGIVKSLGRTPILWNDVWYAFRDSIDKDAIIQVWYPPQPALHDAVEHGYRVIRSTVEAWYLDNLIRTWEDCYKEDMCEGIDASRCMKQLLGGGGEMWGEKIDGSNIVITVWPK
jgi:hexosaminidase